MEIEQIIGEIEVWIEYIFLDSQFVLDQRQEKTVLAKEKLA